MSSGTRTTTTSAQIWTCFHGRLLLILLLGLLQTCIATATVLFLTMVSWAYTSGDIQAGLAGGPEDWMPFPVVASVLLVIIGITMIILMRREFPLLTLWWRLLLCAMPVLVAWGLRASIIGFG